MSRKRLQRIKRLISLRERKLDAARGELSRAMRDSDSARTVHESAETAYRRGIDEAVDAPPNSVADLAEQRDHIRSLRHGADVAMYDRRAAAEREAGERRHVVDEHRELRKMEQWSDDVAQAMEQKRARHERILTDEVAAQVTARNNEHPDAP